MMTDPFDQLFSRGRLTPFLMDADPGAMPGSGDVIQPGNWATSQLPPDVEGLGGTWQRYLASGFYNGDFKAPPPTATSDLTALNPLPQWAFAQASGTAITARWIADPVQGSGGRLDFTMASGAAGDDSYIEQIIPVNATSAREFAYRANLTFLASDLDTGQRVYIEQQFLRKDLTLTGSATTQEWTLGTVVLTVSAALTGQVPPSDAYYLRVRFGLRRKTAANSATVTVHCYETYITFSHPFVHLADINQPANAPISFRNINDTLVIFFSGTSPQFNFSAASAWAIATNVQFQAVDGLITKQVAGVVTDAAFSGGSTLDGAIAHDTTNHRQYYRRGGAWHYSAETAGFEVPANETVCPVCRELMLPDDALIGKVDRYKADGALHGLWVHLRCADLPLDREIADSYWSA